METQKRFWGRVGVRVQHLRRKQLNVDLPQVVGVGLGGLTAL